MKKEYDIKKILNRLHGHVLLDKDGISCRFKDYSYYNGKKEIVLRFYYGVGASETTKEQTIHEDELDFVIDTYTLAPIVEKNQSIIIKPKKETEMSEHTDNNLKGLRTHLFSAIRKLEGGTMKNEDAKAMAQVAQVIINSAKLEMEFKLLVTDKPKIDLLE
jgi:hypothetical protein